MFFYVLFSSFYQLVLGWGDVVLDSLFRGGLRSRMITEIAGESSAGKTQLCLQLLLQVQMSVHQSGLDGKAIYISTEELNPSLKRFHQLIESPKRKNCFASDPASNVIFITVATIEELIQLLGTQILLLLNSDNKIKLVVIDSIAALIRFEFAEEDNLRRTQALWTVASQLHYLCDIWDIVLVVTNQVSAVIHSDFGSSSREQPFCGQSVIPSLGLTWSNCINNRVFLTKTNKHVTNPQSQLAPDESLEGNTPKRRKLNVTHPITLVVRELQVVYSSYLPNSICEFVVTADGVLGLSGDECNID